MSLTFAQRSWLLQQIEEMLGVEDKAFSALSNDDSVRYDSNGAGLLEFEEKTKVNFF